MMNDTCKGMQGLCCCLEENTQISMAEVRLRKLSISRREIACTPQADTFAKLSILGGERSRTVTKLPLGVDMLLRQHLITLFLRKTAGSAPMS